MTDTDLQQALRSFVIDSGTALAATDPKYIRFDATDMVTFARIVAEGMTCPDCHSRLTGRAL